MKFKQKFRANHKYNKRQTGQDRRTFCTVTAIMIFIMNAVVSVNAAATLPTAEHAARATAETAATTMVQTLLNNTSRNPIIAQQSLETSKPPQTPATSMSASPITASATITTATTSFTIQKTNSTNAVAVGVPDTSNSYGPGPSPSPIAENMGSCKSLTGTWGDVDPNIYYLCDMQTKQPLPLRCPEGRGYFNGLGYTGCLPYDDWPACVTPRGHEQVHICDSDHMQQPWETMNPNKFYICLQETIEPMLLNCGQGKGFVHVLVSSGREGGADGGDSEVVGCANWEKWRSYMQCTDYY